MSNLGAVSEQLARADKLWHLEQAGLMEGLSPSELLLVSNLSQDRIYSQGEVIYDQEDPSNALYFLNRGAIRLAVKNTDGREKTIGILSGGDIFGLEVIGAERVYKLQAVAHEESWVSLLTREQFVQLTRQYPALAFNLMQILLQRLGEAHDDIRALCFMDIQQRLVNTLLKLSESHGRRLPAQGNMVKLTVRISHDYLARLIGSNRPYLSNIMSHFKKQGWVRYDRHRLLIDTEALQELA